jgi:hypothetical protein
MRFEVLQVLIQNFYDWPATPATTHSPAIQNRAAAEAQAYTLGPLRRIITGQYTAAPALDEGAGATIVVSNTARRRATEWQNMRMASALATCALQK